MQAFHEGPTLGRGEIGEEQTVGLLAKWLDLVEGGAPSVGEHQASTARIMRVAPLPDQAAAHEAGRQLTEVGLGHAADASDLRGQDAPLIVTLGQAGESRPSIWPRIWLCETPLA